MGGMGEMLRKWIFRDAALPACVAALACGAWTGCDLSNPGVSVPPGDVNFPIALAVVADDPEARFLVVANSNFDLSFSSGSLQSWDLRAIRTAVDAVVGMGCGDIDEPPCVIPIEANGGVGFLTDEVQIGSHADGLVFSRERDRFYLPVRSGRGVLTWVDFSAGNGTFACGPRSGQVPSCDDAHRGADVAPSAEGLTLPTDPVALAVVPAGLLGPGVTEDAIVVAHRSGRASLFIDDPTLPRPVFTDVIEGIPNDIVSAELDPETGWVWMTNAGVAASRVSRELVALSPVVVPENDIAELTVTQRLRLAGVDDGQDTRDIAFEPGTDRAWVLSRRPESVITIDFALEPRSVGVVPISNLFAVAAGPSRIERLVIGGRAYLVVTCYDANNVSVVDPELGLVATVAGLAGPFEMAFDEERNWLFVTNFRNSTIGVIDLGPLVANESPRLIATLGTSDPPTPF
jgi:DNA-binding beta-propeller fold protein YncE